MSAISATAAARARTLSPRMALGAIVLLGTVVNDLLARLLATPGLFPDEYLYSQLGQSIASTGRLTVRGVNPHFLPVLAPILNAPLWLVHDVGTAWRLVQVENALFLSLAAIPTYWLARRLGASTNVALIAGAAAVVGAPSLYAARLLAEPVAYPLFIAALAVGVESIARPSRRTQLAFLAFASLATLARLQLALLPLCVALAILATGLRERRLRAAVREQRLLLGLVGGALAAGLAILFVRGFGYYDVGVRARSTGTMGRIAGVDAYVLLIACGAAIAPSALVGIAQAVLRPRDRRELGFGIVTILVTGGILAQCVLWGDFELVQERYLIYILPLLTLGFCLRRSRAGRRPLAEIGVAAAIAATASLLPLSGYAIDASIHLVPVLDALTYLEGRLDSQSGAAAAFALCASVLTALGAATSSFRRGTTVTMLVSLGGAAAVLGLATTWSTDQAAGARHDVVPADLHWIDHAAPGSKTLLVVGKASKAGTLMNLFWNPSVTRVLRTPKADDPDSLHDPTVTIAGNGKLRIDGAPLTGTVAVSSDPSTVVIFADAQRLRTAGPLAVWRPHGTARLGIVLSGRHLNGDALRTGDVTVWRHGGWLEVPVGAPTAQHVPGTVTIGGTTVHVAAGGHGLARIRVCDAGGWSRSFTVSPARVENSRWIAPTLGMPRFVPDPRACS